MKIQYQRVSSKEGKGLFLRFPAVANLVFFTRAAEFIFWFSISNRRHELLWHIVSTIEINILQKIPFCIQPFRRSHPRVQFQTYNISIGMFLLLLWCMFHNLEVFLSVTRTWICEIFYAYAPVNLLSSRNPHSQCSLHVGFSVQWHRSTLQRTNGAISFNSEVNVRPAVFADPQLWSISSSQR